MSKGNFLGIFSGGAFGSVGRFLSGAFQSLCSFLFDGVDDYFIIDDAISTVANTTEGTWLASVYINTAAPASSEAIISFGDAGASVQYIYVYLRNNGALRIDSALSGVNQWNLISTNQVFTDSTWHTIALVQDGVSPKLYIDGILVAQSFLVSTDTTVWFNDYAGFEFGTLGALRYYNVTDSYFSGYINAVGLLDTDISAAQVLEWHNGNKPLSAKKLFPADCVYSWIPKDALSFDSVNSEWAVPNSVSLPFINKALLFDGVDNYMTMPTTNLDPNIFGGTGNIYTIYATIKAPSQSGLFTILKGNPSGFWLMISFGIIRIVANSNATDFENSNKLVEGQYYSISVSLDCNNTANSKITIEGVADIISKNDTTAINTNPTEYEVGRRDNGSAYYNGYIKSISVINRMTTLAEDVLMYNDGKGADPYTIFNSDCKWFMNADDSSWNGSAYEVTDSVSSNVATSVNMVEADLKYRAPNLSYSQNMVLSSKDCTVNPYL